MELSEKMEFVGQEAHLYAPEVTHLERIVDVARRIPTAYTPGEHYHAIRLRDIVGELIVALGGG